MIRGFGTDFLGEFVRYPGSNIALNRSLYIIIKGVFNAEISFFHG